jgi:hypothetical protein
MTTKEYTKLEAAVIKWANDLDIDTLVNIAQEHALSYYLNDANNVEVEEFIEEYGSSDN